MKALKIVGVLLLSTLLLLLLISFFLPSEVNVERSRVMHAKPDAVYAQVNNLRNWMNWMPWNKKDPNMQIEWGDPTSGVGAGYAWKSEHKEVGNGHLRISQSEQNAMVETEMFFMESERPAYGTFKFEPTAEGTKVVWSMRSDMGKNPVAKLMGLMMDSWVGGDFEKGLEQLDAAAQANPVAEPAAPMVETPTDSLQQLQLSAGAPPQS
jgi:hypothetical protein